MVLHARRPSKGARVGVPSVGQLVFKNHTVEPTSQALVAAEKSNTTCRIRFRATAGFFQESRVFLRSQLDGVGVRYHP
jgi:hypothetical protein